MAPHVLIAGAGIGGLSAALALARAGVDVSIFERSLVLEEIGAGLQVPPNASSILAGLDLLEPIDAIAFRPTGIRLRGARSGRTLALLPLGSAERRWGAPYLVIHRADLQRSLVAAVEAESAIELHLGSGVAGFGTTARGVTVAVKQGLMSRSVAGDALIGADGVRSSVRARLIAAADDPVLETGRMAWRGLVPAKDADPLFSIGETGLWLGRDAHLVTYPVQGGRMVNVVAITREPATGSEELWSRPGDGHVIGARFAGWHRAVRGLIAATPTWTTWPLYDRRPLPAWNAGPVALLGDAAHPILPFLAQGAAQAIEDAAALASAVSQHRHLPEALDHYSRARRARAMRIQEASRQAGRIYHLSGPAAAARNATMRLLGPRRLLARYDWLYRPAASERDTPRRDS